MSQAFSRAHGIGSGLGRLAWCLGKVWRRCRNGLAACSRGLLPVLLGLTLGCGTGLPTAVEVEKALGKHRIVYARPAEERGVSHIYMLNADGRGHEIQLTNHQKDDWDPVWSPNGMKIAFIAATRDGDQILDQTLYIMNADGSEQEQLTTAGGRDARPIWSPDGKYILFVSQRGATHLYRIRVDGTDEVCLSDDPEIDFFQDPYGLFSDPRRNRRQASWSPNSQKIAFEASQKGSSRADIYRVDVNGTNLVNLTPGTEPFDDIEPVWSQDGTQIAFISSRSNFLRLYVMHFDGTNPRRLTSGQGTHRQPCWSQDNHILFDRTQGSGSQIYSIRHDGSDQRRLTDFPFGLAIDASWSPDGRKIAFFYDVERALYVMDADGDNRRLLASSWGNGYSWEGE